jgi:hypothetical protein
MVALPADVVCFSFSSASAAALHLHKCIQGIVSERTHI